MWLNVRKSGLRARFAVTIILFVSLFSDVNAETKLDKNYLRIQKTQTSEKNDLIITSFGALAFTKDRAGHMDLTHIQSGKHGNGVTLDFGGGYVFNWDLSLFLGFGISLGYNRDKHDYIAAYYPEAGVTLDVTESFGITANIKRYHRLYGENDAVVMLGLVFR